MQPRATYNEPVDSDIRVSPFIGMTIRDLMMTIGAGAVVGLVSSGIATLMNKFVFSAVLCRADAASADCVNAPTYATVVALIIGAITALVALAQMRMYRPLLIVIAATAALWGFQHITSPLAWYWQLLAATILFGLVYGLFTWIARIRSFLIAIIVVVVLVVAIRFMLVA